MSELCECDANTLEAELVGFLIRDISDGIPYFP